MVVVSGTLIQLLISGESMIVRLLRNYQSLQWCIVLLVVDFVRGNCQSPQYLQLGTSAIIRCNFDLRIYNVYWYYSDLHEHPFIRYEKDSLPQIYGHGYSEASYTLDTNGSLIVVDVSSREERAFKVLSYNRNDNTFKEVHVVTHTYEKCEQEFPLIDICHGRNSCLISFDNVDRLDCSFGCLMPAVSLTWYIQYQGYRKELKRKESHDFMQILSISLSLSEVNKSLLLPLSNLVCEARGAATDNRTLEASVFIDNPTAWMDLGYNDKYYQINTQVILPCCNSDRKVATYIWERTTGNVTDVVTFVTEGRQHFSMATPLLYFTDSGAIVLSQVDITDEGIYRCKSLGGETFGVYQQSVIVLVTPSPPFVLASECPQTRQACDLTVDSNVTNVIFTCTVNDVYPQLSLNFENHAPSQIQLFHQTSTTQWRNERYSIVASARFHRAEKFTCKPTQETFVICRATGPGGLSIVNPEKKINLFWEECQENSVDVKTGSTTETTILIVAIVSFGVVYVTVVFLMCLFIYIRKKRHKRKRLSRYTQTKKSEKL